LFPFDELYQPTVFNTDFSGIKDDLSLALAIDYKMYLQNDILTKVDRATMSVSLEGREPFLDHRIVEFVAQLPSEFKYGETQKRILKDIVSNYVPMKLMDRPKTGFSVPIYSWLKKDLAYLLEENLNFNAISNTGLFEPNFVTHLKQKFLRGHLNDPLIIWKLLQFQMWFNKWMS
jgi:asparagine synthase (glutamine-hydrolysing)